MGLFTKRPELPADRQAAWSAFGDCGAVLVGARGLLLATLPAGRVEPAPVAIGLDAIATAIADARSWMPAWRPDPDDADSADLREAWDDCARALDEAEASIENAREVATSTGELEHLLGAVEDVVAPLDAFADAEETWRRTWRIPREPR